MKIVTNDEIVKIKELYSEGNNCKIISKMVNLSPYTVRKYIDIPYENKEKIIFNKPLPDFDTSIFKIKDWGLLCLLKEDEVEEIRQLWEEMEF